MNKHCQIQTHAFPCDMTIVLNWRACLAYIAKYASKAERRSRKLKALLQKYVLTTKLLKDRRAYLLNLWLVVTALSKWFCLLEQELPLKRISHMKWHHTDPAIEGHTERRRDRNGTTRESRDQRHQHQSGHPSPSIWDPDRSGGNRSWMTTWSPLPTQSPAPSVCLHQMKSCMLNAILLIQWHIFVVQHCPFFKVDLLFKFRKHEKLEN